MNENIKITITPPSGAFDSLIINDAMKQISDFFDLLEAIAQSIENKKTIAWHLKNITINSPLTIEAQPFASDPAINMEHHLIAVKERFQDGMSALTENKELPDWIKNNDTHLKKILNRNLNGIGRTDIDLGNGLETIVINNELADNIIKNLEKRKSSQEKKFSHKCFGSIEGSIASVNKHYGKPCFYLFSRQENHEIRCMVSDNIAEEIGHGHSINEVWANSRVIVEGMVHYDSNGKANEIQVVNISTITNKDISLDDIYDPDFTHGLSTKDYQERLREGTLDD